MNKGLRVSCGAWLILRSRQETEPEQQQQKLKHRCGDPNLLHFSAELLVQRTLTIIWDDIISWRRRPSGAERHGKVEMRAASVSERLVWLQRQSGRVAWWPLGGQLLSALVFRWSGVITQTWRRRQMDPSWIGPQKTCLSSPRVT